MSKKTSFEQGRETAGYQVFSPRLKGMLFGLFFLLAFSGGESTLLHAAPYQVHSVLVDFDVLKRAQKDLQKDLGLKDHSGSGQREHGSSGSQENYGMADHPVLISVLLLGLGLGILLLGWVIRNEQKKEEWPTEERAPRTPGMENDGLEHSSPLFKKIPQMRESKKQNLKPVLSQKAYSPGTFLSYLEKLDLFLETLQESSENPENSSVSLYLLNQNSAFHSLLSRSSGSRFPRFFRPSLLNEPKQALMSRFTGKELQGTLAEGGLMTIEEGAVSSLCFLFFDARGIAYLILFSMTSSKDPGRWFRNISSNPSEMILNLERYLKEYSRFHYQLPEDTINGYGVLDGRGFENRLFQEFERSTRLQTETLMFVLSIRNERGPEGLADKEEAFMDRLQRGISLGIRNGDSLTRAGDGNLFLLFPETLEVDSPVIQGRLLKIFESTKEELHRNDIRLDLRYAGFVGNDKEKLFQFLASV